MVPLLRVLGDGFLGTSEKLLPSGPEPLHSFLSAGVGADVSMLLLGSPSGSAEEKADMRRENQLFQNKVSTILLS